MLLTSQYNQLISLISYDFIPSLGAVVLVTTIILAIRKKALNTIPYATTVLLAFMALFYLLSNSLELATLHQPVRLG